ncbi:cytochrome P450 [Jackrogersella minutella]|nr:cytochrome P450 [Jackrogersella minutella]
MFKMATPFTFDSHVSTSSGFIFCFMLIFYWAIVRPFYISQLRHVPGPRLAAISSLWLDSRYYNETAVPLIRSLHAKYGPIVRVGPNEVAIDDPKQLSTIYGVRSTFTKPSTALLFQNYGFPNIFSAVTREEHRQRKKHVAKVYTMNAQLNNTSLMGYIQNRIERLFGLIDAKAGKATDIYTLAGYFALDNVSYMVYGESMDTLGGKNLQAPEYIRSLSISGAPFVRFSWLFDGILRNWPLSLLIPQFMARSSTSRDSLAAICQGVIDRVNSKDTPVSTVSTALGYMQSQPEFGTSPTEGQVKSECFDHVSAGADTTAASIAYALYTLSLPRHHKYQDKLRQEVSQLLWPFDFKAICGLPFLDACTFEILRLYAPGPGSLQQRVTPFGEATSLNIQGQIYVLPPGTTVGIQAYSLHHNEAVFGTAIDEFRPERWEASDEKQLHAMKEAWIPFGSGARTCLGMNLAIIELKVLLASVLYHYTVDPDPSMDPDDMSPMYAAVIRPKAERCDLRFTRISSTN